MTFLSRNNLLTKKATSDSSRCCHSSVSSCTSGKKGSGWPPTCENLKAAATSRPQVLISTSSLSGRLLLDVVSLDMLLSPLPSETNSAAFPSAYTQPSWVTGHCAPVNLQPRSFILTQLIHNLRKAMKLLLVALHCHVHCRKFYHAPQ